MAARKPLKGTIANATKLILSPEESAYHPEMYGPNLGYCVRGFVSDHPEFRGIWEQSGFRTSLVVRYSEKTKILETLNSRYKILSWAESDS